MSRHRIDGPWGLSSASGIEDALQAVIDRMPEGWYFKSLQFIPATAKRAERRGQHWHARALRRDDLGLPSAGMDGLGPDPRTALLRLAGHLEGINPDKARALAAGKSWPSPQRVRLDDIPLHPEVRS